MRTIFLTFHEISAIAALLPSPLPRQPAIEVCLGINHGGATIPTPRPSCPPAGHGTPPRMPFDVHNSRACRSISVSVLPATLRAVPKASSSAAFFCAKAPPPTKLRCAARARSASLSAAATGTVFWRDGAAPGNAGGAPKTGEAAGPPEAAAALKNDGDDGRTTSRGGLGATSSCWGARLRRSCILS